MKKDDLKPWRNQAGDERITPRESDAAAYVRAWDRLNRFKPPAYQWKYKDKEQKK